MYNVYVPYDNLGVFSNYYYSNDFSLIYATNDNINFDVINLNNHYSIISTTNIDTSLLVPIDNNLLTNNWTYRTDLVDIFISLLFMISFFIGIPLFLLSRFFKKKY